MPVYMLPAELLFPPVKLADPSGLLAVGGDLSVDRLLLAYRSGIFPWYDEDQPILWWSPDPRFVLFPEKFRMGHGMKPVLKRGLFQATLDRDFAGVIGQCRSIPRPDQPGTWITPAMKTAYQRLHRAGYAHSVETWQDGQLVGGLYGVSLGRCFFGESMFSAVPNASKFALVHLVQHLRAWGFTLIDSQVPTDHLERMGAELIPRQRYLRLLAKALQGDTMTGNWGELDEQAPRGKSA